VNLSDVSAMGAVPEAFALTVGIPQDLPDAWWRRFAQGMGDYARLSGVHLVGGDVIRSMGGLFLSITAWGQAKEGALLERSHGRVGDRLMVMGPLGGSVCGLSQWLREAPEGYWLTSLPPQTDALIAHLRPSPPLWAGPEALRLGARAALDLSDGLGRDVGRLALASQLRIEVELTALPRALCADSLSDEELVSAGEDYGLAILVPRDLTDELQAVGFVEVGEAILGPPGVGFVRHGAAAEISIRAFEHFDAISS
jgi:thiamine-monophosphate kinase